MQIRFGRFMIGGFVGTLCAGSALAHPGHAPTDLAAEISQPLAGPDHFLAFVALGSVLLVTLRAVLKYRASRRAKR